MTDILWAPIDMTTWRETPVMRGRVATERDEDSGRGICALTEVELLEEPDHRFE